MCALSSSSSSFLEEHLDEFLTHHLLSSRRATEEVKKLQDGVQRRGPNVTGERNYVQP